MVDQPLVNIALVEKNSEVNQLVVVNHQVRGIKLFHIDGGDSLTLLPEHTYVLAESSTQFEIPDATPLKSETHYALNCILTTTNGNIYFPIQLGNQLVVREYNYAGWKLHILHGRCMFLPR